MGKRITLSGKHLSIDEIAEHFDIVKSSLHFSFFHDAINHHRFVGFTKEELLQKILEEEERAIILSILAAIEAAFRIDFLHRVYERKKGDVSERFREIHKEKGTKVSFDDDILDTWKFFYSECKTIISDLKGAFKYRHWLAHGRYWEPKLGQRYDYFGVYTLGQIVFENIPLYTTSS